MNNKCLNTSAGTLLSWTRLNSYVALKVLLIEISYISYIYYYNYAIAKHNYKFPYDKNTCLYLGDVHNY